MCGRYALALRPGDVRRQFEQMNLHMSIDGMPEDDEVRQSYNFPPGSFGIVLRADVPDRGAGKTDDDGEKDGSGGDATDETPKTDDGGKATSQSNEDTQKETRYRIQAMKWGLIPFWTKRSPDYSSMLRTINCRDDSLIENRGMWTSMKMKKRCIIVCDGFYEWLKKNNGKDRIPHYTKRKDGKMMCFAGLWDCVKYEGSDEKLYTYTVITTDSNKQLKFLHDRMPVMLENGSEDIVKWLSPERTTWTKELQSLLKPYEGELDCYPVSKDVGKVGNNSPSFIVPIDSKENKSNIANFFGNQKKLAEKQEAAKNQNEDEGTDALKREEGQSRDDRPTLLDKVTADSNVLATEPSSSQPPAGIKREHELFDGEEREPKAPKLMFSPSKQSKPTVGLQSRRKMHSATNNGSIKPKSSPKKAEGSQKITAFFKK
ncbi:DUF159-domain-containing protein [Eremomyces bilateralis CBS 781.70]|uniref:DUF159-domain-containing protein n=1 Tax=Eremomyces bilateralis CBS 781.70 TaxID=1392243 RepID=A0A6G1FVB4_9PEZI|nr:DUF159-domain-containing protein [Eremomyces bilateralis CBS 781.70]KAF1809648.1 DUF159-domain-containing protein [Eremomyces bilateralis CBS 781.70]